MREIARSRFWTAGIAVLAILASGSGAAAVRDTAFYPLSGRSLPAQPAPPLMFETVCDTTVPGLPAADSLVASPDGDSVAFETSGGSIRLDVRRCVWERFAAPASTSRSDPPGLAALPQQGQGPEAKAVHELPRTLAPRSPTWYRRLVRAHMGGSLIPGPHELVGVIGGDGTIYGRSAPRGHLLWRRAASHRTSRPGLTFGDYLLIAPDASRTLEAYRWSDGTPAGIMKLDSEDAVFASAPISAGRLVVALAVQSPRNETRFLALRPNSGVPGPVHTSP